MNRVINIARDFSDVPAGRFPEDGEFNGQRFRREFLVPALRQGSRVEVVFDDTEGFGSSFLEEAFGGLIRYEHFSPEDLRARLILSAKTARAERFVRKVRKHLEDAERIGSQ